MFSGEVLLDSCALMKSAFWSVIPVLWYCVGVGFDWMVERETTGISPGLAPFLSYIRSGYVACRQGWVINEG
jgi:hypothetical protein